MCCYSSRFQVVRAIPRTTEQVQTLVGMMEDTEVRDFGYLLSKAFTD